MAIVCFSIQLDPHTGSLFFWLDPINFICKELRSVERVLTSQSIISHFSAGVNIYYTSYIKLHGLQVGLALVVDGEVVLGVMGCPNVQFKYSDKSENGAPFSLQMATAQQRSKAVKAPLPRGFQSGLLMAAVSGCGCWVRVLSNDKGSRHINFKDMMECNVDGCKLTKEALFCISDNEVWKTLPLAQALSSVAADEDRLQEDEAQVLSLCCGR